jgi:hypothetical protein
MDRIENTVSNIGFDSCSSVAPETLSSRYHATNNAVMPQYDQYNPTFPSTKTADIFAIPRDLLELFCGVMFLAVEVAVACS